MFTELIYMNECFVAPAKRQNIPIIATISCDLTVKYWASLGYTHNPSNIPYMYSNRATKMTFTERLQNTIEFIYAEFLESHFIKSGVKHIYQKYDPNTDPFDFKYSLLFDNSHMSIFPRPNVPNIIQTGGIHLKLPQPLPKVSKTPNFQVPRERRA